MSYSITPQSEADWIAVASTAVATLAIICLIALFGPF